MNEANKLNYFRYANMHESDQETFLVWCLNFLSSDSVVMKRLAQEMIYLFLGKQKDINKYDLMPQPNKRVAYRQFGKIDIAIFFKIKEEKYVIGLEHKVLSRQGNDFEKYYTYLKKECKDCVIKLCLLDPFQKQGIGHLNSFVHKPSIITGEYYRLLNQFIEENDKNLIEISFVSDYLKSFFVDFNQDIRFASHRFKLLYKNLFVDCCIVDIKSGSITIKEGNNVVTFVKENWPRGEYHLLINDERLSSEEFGALILKNAKKKEYIIKDKPKLLTIGDIRKVVYIALEELKRIQQK